MDGFYDDGHEEVGGGDAQCISSHEEAFRMFGGSKTGKHLGTKPGRQRMRSLIRRRDDSKIGNNSRRSREQPETDEYLIGIHGNILSCHSPASIRIHVLSHYYWGNGSRNF